MGSPSKRLAMFLCLIVLHQDFIQARASHYEHLEVSPSSKFRPRRFSFDILEEDSHEFDQSIQKFEARHGISLRSDIGRPLQRGKLAATAVETIYDIAGCCGLGFDYLCNYEANFNKKKADLKTQSELVDQRLENALKKRDDLECLSEVVKATWGSVNELIKLQEDLLGDIDPNFRNTLLKREKKVQETLEETEEELNDNDISNMFLKIPKEELALKMTLGWTAAAVPGIGLIDITIRSDIGRPLNRGKRFFGLFIFIVSLVVTVVATVVETVYDIAGCCGLSFKYLCGFEANFNRKRDNTRRRSEQVDKDLKKALQKKDLLEEFGKVLQKLWGGIINLVKLEEKLLGSFDATLKNILITKEKEVRDSITEAQDQLDESNIEISFQKMSEAQLAISLSTSWVAVAIEGGAEIAGKAYKSYKVRKVADAAKSTKMEKLLQASPKAKKLLGYTDDVAKVALKNTGLAKFASGAKNFLKGLKFFKAAGAVLSVLSIAFDLFNIINTFAQCAGKEKKAKEACGKVEDAERKVSETERNVRAFESTLKSGLEAHIIEQVKDKQMLDALEHVKETIEKNPPPNNGQPDRSWATKCIRIIPEYSNIFKRSTNWKDLKNKMQEIIDDCLSKQEYAYKCLISRNTMNEKIMKGCQRGDKTFERLYADAERLEGPTINQCKVKGEPYTTKEMFKQALVKRSQEKGMEFYTDNCLMNSKIVQDGVCSGGSPSGLTPEQKAQVLQKCEGGKAPKLDADVISDICMYKRAKLTTVQMKPFLTPKKPDITDEDIDGVQCQ
ncbi:hypothetical protein AC249_AIPGENE21158 [Exaiptasia diaphana]|nr:hypothetical protein AC249_AIPGENE21158 [Exaiptasia diaphana]